MPTGGEGGGSSDVRAGGAFVEIYGKDKLTAQLEAIKTKAGGALAAIQKISGSVAGTLGIGLGVGAVVVEFSRMAAGVEKFNAAQEAGVKIAERMGAAQAAANAMVFERVGGKIAPLVEQIPEAGRLAFLNEQLGLVNKNLAGVGPQADKAKNEVTALAGGWNRLQERIPVWDESLHAVREEAKVRDESLSKQRDGLREQQAALREQITAQAAAQKAKPGEDWKKWAMSIEDVNRELKIQIDTVNMTADAAQVYRLSMEAAAKGVKDTGDQLKDVAETMKDLADKKLFYQIKDEGKAFKEELEFSIRTTGMSADEIRLTKLKEMKGGPEVDPELERLIAMKVELEKIGNEKPVLPPGLSVMGSFGGNLGQQLGIGDKWQEKLADKVDITNERLGEIAGKMTNLAVATFK